MFIRKPGKSNEFERHQIFTAKESHDVVVVDETSPDHPGLTPGQDVVTTGSLILEQLYEDKRDDRRRLPGVANGRDERGCRRTNQPVDRDFTSCVSLTPRQVRVGIA